MNHNISYQIGRLPKARPAGEPQYFAKWRVRFCFGGKRQDTTRHPFRVCDACLATEGNPVEIRPDCGCQKKVRAWADKVLEARYKLLERQEMERLDQLMAPRRFTPLVKVLDTYRLRGPEDRVQRLNSLFAIFEQTTGRRREVMDWKELTADLCLDWAELRQEAGRRGWLGEAGKAMPAGGWEELRALKAAGKLPRLDTTACEPWNTTIVGYLRNVKSMFGDSARANELRGCELPELHDFLAVKLAKKLPCPKGHKSLADEVLARIEERLPSLRVEDPQAWLFFMLAEETGTRPVSVRRMKAEALRVLDATEAVVLREGMAAEWKVPVASLCSFAGVLSVQKTKRGNPVQCPVSAAVVACVEEVAGGGSIIGARHATEAREIHNRVNAWLRGCGVEGVHALYLFRHRKAQILRRFGGKEAVMAATGHRTEAMVNRYSNEERLALAVGLR